MPQKRDSSSHAEPSAVRDSDPAPPKTSVLEEKEHEEKEKEKRLGPAGPSSSNKNKSENVEKSQTFKRFLIGKMCQKARAGRKEKSTILIITGKGQTVERKNKKKIKKMSRKSTESQKI